MAKQRSIVYRCDNCGAEFAKWVGRCLECQSFNSVREQTVSEARATRTNQLEPSSRAMRISEIESLGDSADVRRSSGLGFLDKILGEGVPDGTVLLLAGEPGIGKSTLLFQMMCEQKSKVLYVSAEESIQQIARRFRTFKKETSDDLFVISENRIEAILEQIDTLKPRVVVIDSIQMILSEVEGRMKGGASTLREVTEALVSKAKQNGIILWIVGHVNKEGDIAGPKTLEHLVDTVLVFTTAEDTRLRILQTQKHRFGRSGELALLEMEESGLKERKESDSYWVHARTEEVAGCAVGSILMGSRILSIEIQALVVDTFFPSPRRSTSGFDLNRLLLILAVLEKRLKLPFSRSDVYLNVVGGLKISDPAADLAVAAALVSAINERPVPKGALYCGEIGLTGELRQVSAVAERVRAFSEGKSTSFFCSKLGGDNENLNLNKLSSDLRWFETLDTALENLIV